MPRELLATADVAELLGVSVRGAHYLADARRDFPKPYAITPARNGRPGMRLWRREDVERWNATAERKVGRPARAL